MKTFVNVVAGLVLALALSTPNALAARTVIENYDLGAAGDVNQLSQCNIGGNNIGGVCFTVNPGELVVDITINDAAQPTFQVGAYLEFRDSSDAVITTLSFCDAAPGLSIPANAVTIELWFDGLLYSPIDCGAINSVTATYGSVQADFTP